MKRKLGWALAAGAVAVSLTMAGCGGSSSDSGSGDLSVAWWGSQDRNNYTVKMFKKFDAAHSGIKVTPQFTGWDGYWSKMSTEFGGGSAPDVLQMDKQYLRSYADKGTLEPLKSAGVNLGKLDKNSLATGTIDDKLYAIPSGVNAIAMFYDPAILKKAGVDFDPDSTMTWAQFAKIAAQVTKNDKGVYGTQNMMGWLPGLKLFARDNGQELYTDDVKKLAVSKSTVTKWFEYWLELQNKEYTPPASASASVGWGEIQKFPIVKKKAAFGFAWNSQYTAFKQLVNRPLGMTLAPGLGNGNKAYFLKPSMYWSISKTSKSPKEAAKLVSYLVNSPKASKFIGTDRGVPINKDIRKSLEKKATGNDKKVISFISRVDKIAGQAPPVDPSSTSQILDLYHKIVQQVEFKKVSPSAGAANFIKQANSILQQG